MSDIDRVTSITNSLRNNICCKTKKSNRKYCTISFTFRALFLSQSPQFLFLFLFDISNQFFSILSDAKDGEAIDFPLNIHKAQIATENKSSNKVESSIRTTEIRMNRKMRLLTF